MGVDATFRNASASSIGPTLRCPSPPAATAAAAAVTAVDAANEAGVAAKVPPVPWVATPTPGGDNPKGGAKGFPPPCTRRFIATAG